MIGEGEASAAFSVTPKGPPTMPLGVKNLEAQDKSIKIGWSAPVNDGGAPLIDYRIWSDSGTSGATFTLV